MYACRMAIIFILEKEIFLIILGNEYMKVNKILIIIGKLYVGGAERIARDIGIYSNPQEFIIHYLVYGDGIGDYEEELIQHGCIIHHFDEPSKGYIKYIKNLSVLIKKNKYDVIHAHTMFSSGWAMLIGYLYGVPVRITHSHTIHVPFKRKLKNILYENIMRKLITIFATELVACGESAGEWLFGSKVFNKQGKLIYNGIDIEKFIYDEKKRTYLRDKYGMKDRFIIGHAGHLATVKNQIYLIKLMPQIIKKRKNALLLLLGDGKDYDMLLAQVKELRLDKYVLMLGNVSNVGDFMSAMDVFVFPSLYEGMPLALIETQANGLPCCISDKIPEDVYLTDLIHVHALEEPQIWINEICSLKRNDSKKYSEELYQMGFDISSMTEKIYSLYEG